MTAFSIRYKKLLISKTSKNITAVVIALAIAGAFFEIMTPGRALFLFAIYVLFMVIYQALNAHYLPEKKYMIFDSEGLTALGNPITHLPHIGSLLHYLLIGGMFSVALGTPDADPDAAFRGFSTMGLIYAAVYGIFSEMSIKRRQKNQQDDDHND